MIDPCPKDFQLRFAKTRHRILINYPVPACDTITPSYQLPKCPNFQQPPVLPLRLKYLHSPSLGDQTKSLSALRLLFLHLHSSIYLLTCNRTPAPLLLMPGPNRQCVIRQCVVTMRRQGGRGLSGICRRNASSASL
jgi:hypothetical protein